MSRENPDRIRKVNEALLWTGTTVLGLTAVSFALGFAYRTMQAMSYEAMPPVQPEMLSVLVAAIGVGATMLVVGTWGWYCSASRDRVGAGVAETSSSIGPELTANLATPGPTSDHLDEERAPALVSSSAG